MSREPSFVVTSVLAGLAFGAADAALGAASPHPFVPGWATAIAALVSGLAWGGAVGTIAGGVVRAAGAGRRAARVTAAAAVAVVWCGSLLLDRDGEPLGTIGAASAALVAIVLTVVVLSASARAVGRGRWLLAALPLAVLAACPIVVMPSILAFRFGASASRGSCDAPKAPGAETNILLVSVDTLRLDRARTMRSYARLAAHGTEYTQHVAPAPWTLPSIASLLSGLPPEQHGAGVRVSDSLLYAVTPLGSKVPRLAQRLAARGYRTGAIVTNPFLTPGFGVAEGFCSFANLSVLPELVFIARHLTPVRFVHAVAPDRLPSDRADRLRAAAERWLDDGAERPLFLWLHFLDPHAPYGDHPGAWTTIVGEIAGGDAHAASRAPFGDMVRLRAGELKPDGDRRAWIVGLYEEDVRTVDDAIMRLLDSLDARGLAARTTVVLTADHGEEFWDHGGVEHGHTLYDELVHIPLVIARPGDAPRVVDRLTTTIDVPATLLGVAGDRDAGLPGWDLGGEAPPAERAVRLGEILFGEDWAGVRTTRWAYMRARFGAERLFDLAADPRELVDVAAADPARTAEARAQLPADPFPKRDGRGRVPPPPAGLRSLGYVQ